MSVYTTPRGYTVTSLRGKTHSVHKLVLETFVGPRPDKLVACHHDNDGANNHLSNLRWDTQAANMRDKRRHGTSYNGSRLWSTNLTEDDVRVIRTLVAAGWKHSKVADYYGLTSSSVCRIANRDTWKHVK